VNTSVYSGYGYVKVHKTIVHILVTLERKVDFSFEVTGRKKTEM
jgi:hypothetical protein